MDYLTFFHCSDIYLEQFSSREPGRPTFFWYSDVFHTHNLPRKTNWYKFFNLFVKNPRKDNIALRARHDIGDFHSLHQHFVNYDNERIAKLTDWMTGKEYIEPGIIMSYSSITPDLTAEFENDTSPFCVVVKPDKYKGLRIRLMDDNRVPIHFLKIPELIEIVPPIVQSHPFIEAKQADRLFIYEDWMPIVTDMNGTWI